MPIIEQWQAMGYHIALLRQGEVLDTELCVSTERYYGWARSINILARLVLDADRTAEWIVSGGDDTEPDKTRGAEAIASECRAHFGGTFGVMQPTGDRWADGSIDRICGSPWLGREFCRRMYHGNGPMCERYNHMFGDEELQHVATRHRVLWQRRDLTHLHHHYFRTATDEVDHGAVIPPHMLEWNLPEHWVKSQALFRSRQAAGFPGSEPMLA